MQATPGCSEYNYRLAIRRAEALKSYIRRKHPEVAETRRPARHCLEKQFALRRRPAAEPGSRGGLPLGLVGLCLRTLELVGHESAALLEPPHTVAGRRPIAVRLRHPPPSRTRLPEGRIAKKFG